MYQNEQLQADALICKALCLYILEQKTKWGTPDKAEMRKIAPNIYVFVLLNTEDENKGPFLYDAMIGNILEEVILKSFEGRSWDEELIRSLLTTAGVTEVSEVLNDFSMRPTGYYRVAGIFQGEVPFWIYNRVGTE